MCQSRLVSYARVVLAVLVILAETPAVFAQTYQITSVTVPAGQGSQAYGINASGEIVGTAAHAFASSNGTFEDLGTLGGRFSYGFAINSSGQTAGYSQLKSPAIYHAFLDDGGKMIDLGTLGGSFSLAAGINDAGQVVGYSQAANGQEQAFVFGNGHMTGLGTLGGPASFAYGINNLSEVVGATYTKAGHAVAFLYQNGRMQSLGTLGGDSSAATAINGAGQVVGQASTAGNLLSSAFLWQSGVMVDIDTLGSAQSIAQAINSAGVVVGRANISQDPDVETWHAFVYRNGQMLDLNTLIPPNSGWLLTIATGINDTGHIVGFGIVNGRETAFLLIPR